MNQENIYEVQLHGVNGEENFLQQFKGKVTLIINVTGHCGNAPQFGIIQKIYDKYKDRGFEVVAVPTNDYCGPKITYGIYENGIDNGKMAEEYARSEWNVTYLFTELVISRDNRGNEPEKIPHELYQTLNPDGESAPINGNFEKFLVSKNGKRIIRLANGVLLNYAFEDGYCGSPEAECDALCQAIEEALEEEYLEE
jgi:glutathione peroxidase